MAIVTTSRPSLSMRDIIGALPILCQWRNSKGRLMPIHLESAPGAGKTVLAESIIRTMARQRPGVWVGLSVNNPGIQNPTEAAGYPVFGERTHADGVHYKVSERTLPDVIHVQYAVKYLADSDTFVESRHDDNGQPLVVGAIIDGVPLNHGLILLDEYGQADTDVKKNLAPLKDEARLATFILPLGWWVWSLSNRAADASGITRSLAFDTNRECRIGLTPDIDALTAYLTGVSLLDTDKPLLPLMEVFHDERGRVIRDRTDCDSIAHPAMLSYLRQNADVLYGGVPADPGQSFLTQRSAEAVSNLFDLMLRLPVADESGAMDPHLTFQDSYVARSAASHDAEKRWRVFAALAGGTIGTENTSQFLATLELFEEVPTIAEIVANPRTAKVSRKTDAQFVVVHMIANAMTQRTAGAMHAYAQRLLPSNYHNCILAAATRDSALMMVREIAQFFNDNPDSLARMVVMQGNARVAQGRNA